jgi:hypothetical protein
MFPPPHHTSDSILKRFLQGYAVAHHTTTARLVREVLGEWVYERVDPTPSKRVDHTLHRLDLLSKQLQLKIALLPAKGDMVGSGISESRHSESPTQEPMLPCSSSFVSMK